MNLPIRPTPDSPTVSSSANRYRGFTLTELLVVVAVVGLLAVTLLPALAGTKRNTKRAQCMSNLRQLSAACAMYAGDFNGWYPVWYQPDGGHPVNVLKGQHYTRYIFGAFGDLNKPIPQTYILNGVGTPGFSTPNPGNSDQNLGYLYAGGFIADGKAMWCPGRSNDDGTTNLLSREYYSTPKFFSTDASGSVRSSYTFNPRMVQPGINDLRKYQKNTDPKVRDVFLSDYLEDPNGRLPQGVPFTPAQWAHWPFQGLVVGYTDGSASSAYSPAAFALATQSLITDESTLSAQLYDTLWNDYRDAPQ